MSDHPALARIPVWVQEKLSPKAIEKIKHVFDWVCPFTIVHSICQGVFGIIKNYNER